MLVLQREEDRIALARPLADKHQPGDGDAPPVGHVAEPGVGCDTGAVEVMPEEGHRMRLQRHAQRAVVVDDMLAKRHARQLRLGLVVDQLGIWTVKQRQHFGSTPAVECPYCPHRCAPVDIDRAEGIGLGEQLDLADVEP